MHKIMIIEDDPSTREELTLLLENEGHQVLAVTDFTDVAGQLRDFGPHLALLDLGLPGKDGFTLCMEIRRDSDVPVIFLTSRDSAMDELQALPHPRAAGPDQYRAAPGPAGARQAGGERADSEPVPGNRLRRRGGGGAHPQ